MARLSYQPTLEKLMKLKFKTKEMKTSIDQLWWAVTHNNAKINNSTGSP